MDSQKSIINIYARLPAETVTALDVKRAPLQINRPEAIVRAIHFWLGEEEPVREPGSAPKITVIHQKVPDSPGPDPSSELGIRKSPNTGAQDSLFHVQSPHGESETCSEEEWPWVMRTLAVVRGHKGDATKALDSILDAFSPSPQTRGTDGKQQQFTPVSEQADEHLHGEVDPLDEAAKEARRIVERAKENADRDLAPGKAVRKRRTGNQSGA